MAETNLAKIAVSSAADEALTQAVARVNHGFSGGRVTKAELATWFLLDSTRRLDDAAVEEIRKVHFNQVVYLESLVRTLKSAGRDSLGPEELSRLQMLLSQEHRPKKDRSLRKKSSESLDDSPKVPNTA